ncbi:MAG: SGNH/GDSL hydrolase family protein [Anaerolineales bacterium]|nr:SGNH/GDSL hydrolase family protein [Anaerolineales bacterium]
MLNFRNIFMFLALLFLISCGGPVATPAPSNQTYRYLALGDSYTIGESVSETERWPNQLAALVDPSKEIEVTIIARTGWTTSELWEGIQAANPQGTYDMVSLLIGVNNQYRGYDMDEYREEFRFLLGKAVEFADGKPEHVIVLSIPDWGVTPFAWGRDTGQIAADIDAYNAINLEESKKAGVHYVDVTPASREAVTDQALIAGDGLHPSGKMYAEWAKLALSIAVKILE